MASWLLAPLLGLTLMLLGVRISGLVLEDGSSRPLLGASKHSPRTPACATPLSAGGGERRHARLRAAARTNEAARRELVRVLLVVWPECARCFLSRRLEPQDVEMAALGESAAAGGARGDGAEAGSGGGGCGCGSGACSGCGGGGGGCPSPATTTPPSPRVGRSPTSRRRPVDTPRDRPPHLRIRPGEVRSVTPLRELGVPELFGSETDPPCILSDAQRRLLLPYLPAQLQMHEWVLRYSTEQHGCSLRTAYSRVAERGPSLLIVRDLAGHTFGGFASEPWHVSPSYYGNGECFLFKAAPAFQCFPWSGANTHFQLGFADSLAFGGGGQFGVWLDEAFEYGSSGRCDTFGNDVLSSTPDFKVSRVELWGFEYSARSPPFTPHTDLSPSAICSLDGPSQSEGPMRVGSAFNIMQLAGRIRDRRS